VHIRKNTDMLKVVCYQNTRCFSIITRTSSIRIQRIYVTTRNSPTRNLHRPMRIL